MLRSVLNASLLRSLLPLFSAVATFFALYLIFVVVPNERVMGAVQRIFYFHVGAAFAAYLSVGILFVAALAYLATRKREWDALAEASSSVALTFSSIVLASGMIWGHSAWNVWWRWEPRLVSFLVLWLLLLAATVLRSFTSGDSLQRNFFAVLGILSAVMIPVVIYSVQLLDHSEQLHPQVIAKRGIRDVRFTYALIAGSVAMLSLSLWLVCTKTLQYLHRDELFELRRSLALRGS